jgi:hypothetical protein
MVESRGDRLADRAALHQPAFDVAPIMFRLAVARCQLARRMAGEHAETGKHERRLREIDAVIETIVLAQAACESWIFFAYRHTDIEPRERVNWVQHWIDAPQRICDQKPPDKPPMRLNSENITVDPGLIPDPGQPHDRPPTRSLDESTVETLRLLSAWRNFLLHNDQRSRDSLRKTISQDPDPRLLTADMAEQTISSIDQAFADLGSLLGVYGVLGLSSDHLWVAPDE